MSKDKVIITEAEEVEVKEAVEQAFTAEFSLEHGRLTLDALELTIQSNLQHMEISANTGDMETVKECSKLALKYNSLIAGWAIIQANVNNEIARLALGAAAPTIANIYSQIELPDDKYLMQRMTFQLTSAQDAIEQGADEGMSASEVKKMFKRTYAYVKDGEVIYNPERIDFYRKMKSKQKVRLDAVLTGFIENGERDIAVAEFIRFVELNNEYAFAVLDIDRYAIKKAVKDRLKSNFLSKDPFNLDYPAFKVLQPEEAESITKAPKDYWNNLSDADKNKVAMHYITEKVESINNEEFILQALGEMSDADAAEFKPTVVGKTRIDVLVHAELCKRAHRYIDQVKAMKNVKELHPQPKGFVIIMTIGELKGDESTLVAIHLTPTHVLFNKTGKRTGYIKYDSAETLEIVASHLFSSVAKTRMGSFKLSFKDMIEVDSESLTKELLDVFPRQLGVWFNEFRVVDFDKTAKEIASLPQGGELGLITAAIQTHYPNEVKAANTKPTK